MVLTTAQRCALVPPDTWDAATSLLATLPREDHRITVLRLARLEKEAAACRCDITTVTAQPVSTVRARP